MLCQKVEISLILFKSNLAVLTNFFFNLSKFEKQKNV